MPDREEILSGLYGAYRLAWFDPSGMAHFNLTVDGFWHSFFAAVLVAPAYAILVVMRGSIVEVDLALVFLTEGIRYVLAWCTFPVVALLITRLLGLDRNYVPLIVAHNWSAVLEMAAFVSVVLLGGILPAAISTFLVAVTMIALLVYKWFVIRTALVTSGGIALLLLLVDLMITSIISAGADRLL